jgi:hypothetical protein
MVDSPLAGGWMASEYDMLGRRVDHELGLFHDGRFIWRAFGQTGWQAECRGQWSHADGESVLRLSSAEPLPEFLTESWAVLEVAGLGRSNTCVVLRRVALASRNLPVLFYRVRPSSFAEPGAAADPRRQDGSGE